MDAFVTSTRRPPVCLLESSEIRDRDSIFVGAIYRATSPKAAKDAVRHHRLVVHGPRKATHEINAWRVMSLKSGKDGLAGPDDFEVNSGFEDDGEKYGGNKILKAMQNNKVLDVVVIVSRWFGGTLLGPIRFTHVENCANEVCRKFKLKEELDEILDRLRELDGMITDLRRSLAKGNNTSVDETPRKPKYDEIQSSQDLEKAKRLLRARENTISSLKKLSAPDGTHH